MQLVLRMIFPFWLGRKKRRKGYLSLSFLGHICCEVDTHEMATTASKGRKDEGKKKAFIIMFCILVKEH